MHRQAKDRLYLTICKREYIFRIWGFTHKTPFFVFISFTACSSSLTLLVYTLQLLQYQSMAGSNHTVPIIICISVQKLSLSRLKQMQRYMVIHYTVLVYMPVLLYVNTTQKPYTHTVLVHTDGQALFVYGEIQILLLTRCRLTLIPLAPVCIIYDTHN